MMENPLECRIKAVKSVIKIIERHKTATTDQTRCLSRRSVLGVAVAVSMSCLEKIS